MSEEQQTITDAVPVKTRKSRGPVRPGVPRDVLAAVIAELPPGLELVERKTHQLVKGPNRTRIIIHRGGEKLCRQVDLVRVGEGIFGTTTPSRGGKRVTSQLDLSLEPTTVASTLRSIMAAMAAIAPPPPKQPRRRKASKVESTDAPSNGAVAG